jgi:hypothetical protein
MGSPVPKDVQDAFYRVVHDRDVVKLAGQMGMSPGVLYNKANPNESSHHKPTLADCIILTNLTGDKRIAQAFCHSVGGAFCALPDLSNLSTDALLIHLTRIQMQSGDFHRSIHLTRIQMQSGDFHRSIHDALKEDNEISGRELRTIEAEAQGYIGVILESLARMREMAG